MKPPPGRDWRKPQGKDCIYCLAPFRSDQLASDIPEADGRCFWRLSPEDLFHLLGWSYHLLTNIRRTYGSAEESILAYQRSRTEARSEEVQFLQRKSSLCWSYSLKEWNWTWPCNGRNHPNLANNFDAGRSATLFGFCRVTTGSLWKTPRSLLHWPPSCQHQSKSRGKKKPHSQKPWTCGPDQDAAFKRLKDILSLPPVLGYADFSLQFELHTDASRTALGCVLYQGKDGVKRVIAYASRTLGKAEHNSLRTSYNS